MVKKIILDEDEFRAFWEIVDRAFELLEKKTQQARRKNRGHSHDQTASTNKKGLRT
jgi:hypothetical protein